MRTTIRLNDAILAEAKSLAAKRHTTLTALIDEGLRYVLSFQEKHVVKSKPYVKLKTVTGGGVCENVELDSYAKLVDKMDGLT